MVGRPHNHDVTYKVIMDSAGPFHYRLFALMTTPEQVEERIRYYLGPQNIVELYVGERSRHQVGVELRLTSPEITNSHEVFGVSPMNIEDEVRLWLPEEHLIAVTVLRSVDLGGYGPHR